MILSLILLIIGCFFELFAVKLCLNNIIVPALFSHLCSALVVILGLKLFLSRHFKSSFNFYLYSFLLCFFVPIFGIALAILISFCLYKQHGKSPDYAEFVDDLINLDDIQPIYSHYGAGGATFKLMKRNEQPLERTRALFDLSQTQLAQINKILYKLLPDTSDEIRLLAFNILDQEESLIAKEMHKLFAMLKTPDLEPETYAKFKKNIASLYWELFYQNLILKELEKPILENALNYADSVISVLKNDSTLLALLGKIHLGLGELPQATEWFSKTTHFNIAPSQVYPYLAEINYKLKDYVAVQKYLNMSETLSDIEAIAPVKLFWNQS